MALWGLKIKPGKRYVTTLPCEVKLTNACLRDADESHASVPLFVKVNDVEFKLCSFIPGELEQHNLDLMFSVDDELSFRSEGNVDLLGYRIFQEVAGDEYFDISDDEMDESTTDESAESEDGEGEGEPKEKGISLEEALMTEDLSTSENDMDYDPNKTVEGRAEAEDSDNEEEDESETSSEDEEEKNDEIDEKGDVEEEDTSSSEEEAESSEEEENDESSEEEEEEAPVEEVQKKRKHRDGDNRISKKAKKIETAAPKLKIVDLIQGKGVAAGDGTKALIHFTGKLSDGKIIDSTKGKKPKTLKIGSNKAMKGLEEAIKGMKPGGRRMVTIPPELAYGKAGVKDIIPPNASMQFDIKYVKTL